MVIEFMEPDILNLLSLSVAAACAKELQPTASANSAQILIAPFHPLWK